MSINRNHRITLRKRRRPIFAAFTIERTLLAGFLGLTALGMAQPSIISFAFNDKTPEPTMTAQAKAPVIASRATTDQTPVGSIERKPVEPAAPGLRPSR